MEKCPNGTIYNESTNICNVEKNFENPIVTTTFINKVFTENIKEITIIEEEKEIDTYNNLTDEKKIAIEDELLINLKEDIMNGRLDDIIKNVTKNKEDYVMKKDNIIYQITTSENQKNKTSYEISSIDLLECETILKEKYDINKTLPLIILEIDFKSNYTLIPLVGYEVYHPENKSKLDLSYCNYSVLLGVPALVDENKIFRNDPNSDFYYDNYFSYTTENGTDIILNDRK